MEVIGQVSNETGDSFVFAAQKLPLRLVLVAEPLTLFGGDKTGRQIWGFPTGSDLGLVLPSIKPQEQLGRALITLGLILHRKGRADAGCPSGSSHLCLGELRERDGALSLDPNRHKDLSCFSSILNGNTLVNLIYVQKQK